MEKSIEKHFAAIKSLMLSHQVEKAYFFGSAVKGKMQPSSDVDFLVRFADDINFDTYAENYFDLLYALQDLLQRNVDLVEEKTITNPYFLESINQNKLAVW